MNDFWCVRHWIRWHCKTRHSFITCLLVVVFIYNYGFLSVSRKPKHDSFSIQIPFVRCQSPKMKCSNRHWGVFFSFCFGTNCLHCICNFYRNQHTRLARIPFLPIRQWIHSIQSQSRKWCSYNLGRKSKRNLSSDWNFHWRLGKYKIDHSLQQKQTRSFWSCNTRHFEPTRISRILGTCYARCYHGWTGKWSGCIFVMGRSESIHDQLLRRLHWLGSKWRMDHWW